MAPGRGFPKHAHRDLEIITYILEGALKHDADQEVTREMEPLRYAWIQVARGSINVNGESAKQGVIVVGESSLKIRAEEPGEILLFDLQ